MSTVTIVRKNGCAAIACDSLTTRGPSKESGFYVVNNSKIIHVNGSYIGITGATASKLALQHYFTFEETQPKLTTIADIFATWLKVHESLKENYFLRPEEDDDDSFESSRMDVVIINAAGIFVVAAHRSVSEFSRFYAIGSGSKYALGAMYADYSNPALEQIDIARRGVEAAAEFDNGTGAPILSFSLQLQSGTGE
jgi:ATP-dependent HslUV protease subunit HslV